MCTWEITNGAQRKDRTSQLFIFLLDRRNDKLMKIQQNKETGLGAR